MDNRISPNYNTTGTLIVAVSAASGALPIEGALVTVKGSTNENAGVLSVVTTDRSGRTPRITLPAPPAAESESPGIEKPYATYNVDVDKNGFFPQSFTNVPIFAGTTSIQPVNLIPLTEYGGAAQNPGRSNITEYENPEL